MSFDGDKYDKDQAAFSALRNSQFYSSRMDAMDFAILKAFIERSHGFRRASRLPITDEEARKAEIFLYLRHDLASEAEDRLRTAFMAIGSAVATTLLFLVLLAIAPAGQSINFVLGCLACSMMLGFFLFAALWLGGFESLKAKMLTLIRSQSTSKSAS